MRQESTFHFKLVSG